MASYDSGIERRQLIPSKEAGKNKEKIKSTKSHWKNIIVLCLTLLFSVTGFSGAQNIQTSINSSEALGLLSLSTIYATLIFSNFLNPFTVELLRPKWAIIFSAVSYCIYPFANFYSTHVILLPSSFIVGLFGSMIWVSTGTYVTTAAFQFAESSGEAFEGIMRRSNGLLYAFYQTNQVWGNLISYFVLKTNNSEKREPVNEGFCGVNSCGAEIQNGTQLPDQSQINLLLTSFSIFGFVAVCLPLCFLDELPSSPTVIEAKPWKSQLIATVRLMGDMKLILLVPIMMYSGIEFAFLVADFTKAYVTCTQDVSTLGLVMTGFGVSGVLAGPILGELVKKTGRIFLFCLGATLQLSLLVYLYLWDPKTSQFWQLLAVAVGWGIADATWMVQILSLTAFVFPTNQEPAFANCNLWQSAGFFVTFITSVPKEVCLSHKIIGIGSWLIVSMIMYFICELKVRRRGKNLIIQDT